MTLPDMIEKIKTFWNNRSNKTKIAVVAIVVVILFIL
jgi:flagellar biosynthesis/type III secretory pathway M-ring protein FliF/YscJ